MERVVREVFARAIERPPERRQAFVERALHSHPELLEEVRSLLMAHARAGRFLDLPDSQEPQPEPVAEDEVPGYRIERLLGTGGFGEVYLANELGSIERPVALKLLRPELIGESVKQRFESERRILARLEHEGIARIYAAGTSRNGRLYYAMELVDGPALTDHCNRARASLDDRLRLFVRVCRAVAYAHQRGVIHGDLKPLNILVSVVDDRPNPKIIDFGVSWLDRAAGSASGKRSSRVGTPAYMSPERLDPDQLIDTRADVFSLGVMLRELLAGTPARLSRTCRADLDAICARATADDADQRYDTVAMLAADVERHLDHRPVTARHAGVLYVGGRFLRRHRLWVLALATTLLAALGIERAFRAEGIATEAQRSAAEWELASADALAFVEELFQSPAMNRLGRTTRLEDLLEAGSRNLAGRFATRPLARARIHVMLGRAWFMVGAFERSESEFRSALELLRPRSDVDPLVVAELTVKHALAQNVVGDRHEVLVDVRRILPVLFERRSERPDLLIAARTALVDAIRCTEGPGAALIELRAAYQQAMELLGPAHDLTAATASQLAQFEQDYGDPHRATELLAVSAQAGRTANSGFDTANAALLAGRLVDAELIATELHASQRESHGADHPDTISTLELLGFIALSRNEPSLAESRLTQAVDLWQQRFGEDHERVRFASRHLGEAMLMEGRAQEVVELVEELHERQRASGRGKTIEDADLDSVYASALFDLGRVDEAIERQRDVVREIERLTGAANRRTYQARSRLAQLTAGAGRVDEAAEALTALHHEMILSLGEAHPDTLEVQGVLARLADGIGDSERAETLLTTRQELALAAFGSESRITVGAALDVAAFLTAHGRVEEARESALRYRERFQAIAMDPSATVMDREAFARWLMDLLPLEVRDPKAAAEVLAADVVDDGASAQVLMTSAKAHYLAGDLGNALTQAERAATLAPNDAMVQAIVDDLREAAQRVR